MHKNKRGEEELLKELLFFSGIHPYTQKDKLLATFLEKAFDLFINSTIISTITTQTNQKFSQVRDKFAARKKFALIQMMKK